MSYTDGDSSGSSGAGEHPGDRALYAVLNVRPDATDEEIRRSYRQLATTYHPDKAQDPALHSEAARAFTRIQEAYEILSDPQRRDIYDVYGMEGLTAGMELAAAPGKSAAELRKEWEAAHARRRQDQLDAAVNFRGQYAFRIDASALANPYARNVSRTPDLTSVSMTSGVDIPIEASKHWGVLGSEHDILHLGGFAYVRGDHGGGSFLAGYRRVYSDQTTLDLQAAAGLKSLLSATTSVQLSPYANASLTVSWQPKRAGNGLGLSFATSRQVGEATSGEFAWVVGPREEAGMTMSLTHRPSDDSQITGRIEVGAATGLTLRYARRVIENVMTRAALKLGLTGVEIDLGASRRLSDISSAGMSVVTGVGKGILLRLRYSRGGHFFEFPILLSAMIEPRMLVAAHIIPPLMVYAMTQWVAAPLVGWVEARRTAAERQTRAAEIVEAVASAAAAAALMAPVARRRASKEAEAQGLLVALALYGEERAVKGVALDRLRQAAATAAETPDQEVNESRLSEETTVESPPGPPIENGEDGGLSSVDGGGVPPAVIDVTIAVQYLCDNGKIVLHKGYSKSGLMGFCDPAPGAPKALLVYYTFQRQWYVATLSDSQGAVLPGRGSPLNTEGVEVALATAAVANRWEHRVGIYSS